MSSSSLVLSNITKIVDGGTRLLFEGLSLELPADSASVLVGPSGCGKSTLCRMIAGFDRDYEGKISFRFRQLAEVTPSVQLITQEPYLFPWLTVQGNVEFGLGPRVAAKSDRDRLCQDLMHACGLWGLEHRKTRNLSGGETRRVALARALAARPQYIIVDESFSSLDIESKTRLMTELKKLQSIINFGLLIVTHDRHDANCFGDVIVDLGKLSRSAWISLPQNSSDSITTVPMSNLSGTKGIL